MKKQVLMGELCVLETNDLMLVGRLYWSDKKNFRFMLEFNDPFKYHQRIYFNDTRNLRKMEIAKYECRRINENYARSRVTTSVGSSHG